MRRCFAFVALFCAIVGFAFADETITGTVANSTFLDFVVLAPEVCGENVFTVLTCCLIGECVCDFSLSPPSGCSFCDTFGYWVTVVHDDGDTVHEPGEPLALYGPFDVDSATCDFAIPETLVKITEGGFEGTIYNATDADIDSVMINIYHHYIGGSVDSYALEITLPPQNLTPLGGGAYHYQMTGISSGGKRVEFFSDANGNGILDPGERATVIERDIPITGNQYDDSVDVDLTMLSVKGSPPKPLEVVLSASPNPFNSSVSIFVRRFVRGERVLIRDLCGRVVRRIPAATKVVWDGKDQFGNRLPSGMYMVTLERDKGAWVRVWLIR